MGRDASSLVGIYLRDHHAAGSAGVALAKRAATRAATQSNGGHAEALTEVATEIEADLLTLERMMAGLGVHASRSKDMFARLAERFGRLKLNGRLVRTSALSDVVELEMLVVGISGKQALWESLQFVSSISEGELRLLTERAVAQKDTVESCRRSAARRAFAAMPSTR